MADQTLSQATTVLAAQASELSQSLQALKDACGHDETSNDISAIADELVRLSTTLSHLQEAIQKDRFHYTKEFFEDLEEIEKELRLVFEEIEECCSELHRVDPAPMTAAVPWFFKKGRVTKLQKHLHALKTTLTVMKTVLQHGTEYGSQTSSEFATNPRSMSEDRVILESVLANNRNAIIDLHNLDTTTSHTHEHSNSSVKATTPETLAASQPTLPVHDGLTPSASPNEALDQGIGLSRRFTKRGVRLGVHNSILNLGADNTDVLLRQKWLQQARSAQHARRQSQPQLSDIPEDNSVVVSEVSSERVTPDVNSPASLTGTTSGGLQESTSNKTDAKKSHHSPVSKTVRRVMRKLSKMAIRDKKNEQDSHRNENEQSTENGVTKFVEKVLHHPDIDPSSMSLSRGFVMGPRG